MNINKYQWILKCLKDERGGVGEYIQYSLLSLFFFVMFIFVLSVVMALFAYWHLNNASNVLEQAMVMDNGLTSTVEQETNQALKYNGIDPTNCTIQGTQSPVQFGSTLEATLTYNYPFTTLNNTLSIIPGFKKITVPMKIKRMGTALGVNRG